MAGKLKIPGIMAFHKAIIAKPNKATMAAKPITPKTAQPMHFHTLQRQRPFSLQHSLFLILFKN
jgi:hypothetical protein